MSRTTRLLDLLQILRRHRLPVSGGKLAEELGISLRTLYRDIGALQSQGADIQGEPGIGYVLKPGHTLPPLMFTQEEIESIVLGSRWVANRSDDQLAFAARNALAKIAAVLPDQLRQEMEWSSLLVGLSESHAVSHQQLAVLRQAIRRENKVLLQYRDLQQQESTRTVWPFAIGFFDHTRVIAAWCELRQAFRHFRTDNILKITVLEDRYPKHRQQLLAEWRKQEGISPT